MAVITGGFVLAAAVVERSGDDSPSPESSASPTHADVAADTNGSGGSRPARQDREFNTPSSTTRAPTTTESESPPVSDAEPQITFNDLGGGSSVIKVYASPNSEDSETSTYFSGDTATAMCRAEGRIVSSEPALGEEVRSESTWIEMATSSGLRRFASLTYADLNVDLQALDTCTNVP